MNVEVELSLKYPTMVPGVGPARVVAGSTTSSSGNSFEFAINRIYRRGRWLDVVARKVWISENSVVSRSYIQPMPVQKPLIYLGELLGQ